MKTVEVKVKPGSKRTGLEELENGVLEVRVKAPPVDGKANAELLKVLAKHFGVKRGRLKIKSGAGTRLKRVSISD